MPSKNNLSILKLQKTIDNLKEDMSKLPHDNVYINKITKKLKPQTYGLIDLIDGKTPTLIDWTNDPTDAANITDDNINTFCTTGNRIIGGGWQWTYFEWDLGGMYDVLLTGVGTLAVTAGTGQIFLSLYNGAGWIEVVDTVCCNHLRLLRPYSGCGSKLRIGITSTAAATITPNIREFHAWRLK